MKMKKVYKQLLMILVAAFVLCIPGQVMAADTAASPILHEIEGVPDYGTCENGDCMDERNETVSTAPFLQQSFLSLDADIAEQELEKDYVKYLWNSAATVIGDYLDFFRPETVMMMITNLLTYMFEMVGVVVTTLIMILYNLTSSSFINTVISGLLDMVDQFVFQWQDMDSWIYKLIIIFALISFVTKIVSDHRKIVNSTQIVNTFFEVLISAVMIIGIGIYGRPVINYADNMINELISVTFELGEETDEPMEIRNKELLFDTLQMQSFKIRHFGSLEIDDVEYENEDGEMEYVSAEERLNDLLVDQTWETAWREYDEYGNTNISHNLSSCLQVMFLSIIFLVHRVLLAILYGALCIVIGLLKLLKELSLAMAIYQMIYTLLKGRQMNTGFWWLQQRLSWIVVCMLGNVIFTTALYLMSKLITVLSAVHPLALIAFDLMLLILIKVLLTILPRLISNLSKDTLLGIVSGTIDPRAFYNKISGKQFRPSKSMPDDLNGNERSEESDYDVGLAEDTPPEEVPYDANDDLAEYVDTEVGVEPETESSDHDDRELEETIAEKQDEKTKVEEKVSEDNQKRTGAVGAETDPKQVSEDIQSDTEQEENVSENDSADKEENPETAQSQSEPQENESAENTSEAEEDLSDRPDFGDVPDQEGTEDELGDFVEPKTESEDGMEEPNEEVTEQNNDIDIQTEDIDSIDTNDTAINESEGLSNPLPEPINESTLSVSDEPEESLPGVEQQSDEIEIWEEDD